MTDALSRPDPGPVDHIDPLIHAPARLKIMTQLFVVEAADATYLINRTGLTWGNLSTHLSKLEEAGYVDVTKGYQGRKPCTMLQLSKTGRKAFRQYRNHMQAVLDEITN
jgi:DNA-binding MarR family transcriptional regulator